MAQENKVEEAKQQEQKWEVTTERFVAFIDIMGFKDMVLRSTHEKIYSMMMAVNERTQSIANIRWSLSGGDDEKLIRTTTYSDSIIIYSKDNSRASCISFCNTVAGLVSELFTVGIPHKGAVAYGKMTLDTTNSIFFGQPLIDAYLLQEELNFYGVVVHGSAEMPIVSFDIKALFIEEYLCPLKQGVATHLTIFPMMLDGDSPEYKQQRDELYQSLKKFKYFTSGHIRKYIDNTEAYFKFINPNIIL